MLYDRVVTAMAMLLIMKGVSTGRGDSPSFVCGFYIAMDVKCSTSSIFNLVAISIDSVMIPEVV